MPMCSAFGFDFLSLCLGAQKVFARKWTYITKNANFVMFTQCASKWTPLCFFMELKEHCFVTFFVGLSFWNERPYLIVRLNLMILFCGFHGWKPRILKIVGGAICQNPWFLAKICSFWPKTTDFQCYNPWFSWKPRILAKNHGFSAKTAVFMKTTDFGWKLWIFSRKLWIWAKNCGFCSFWV